MISLINAAVLSTLATLTAQPATPAPLPAAAAAIEPAAQDALLIEVRVCQFKQEDAKAAKPANGDTRPPAKAPPVVPAAKPAVERGKETREPEVTHLDPMVPMLADIPLISPLQIVKPDALVMISGKSLRLTAPDLTTKTIAAPRVLCLPGQPARLTVGKPVTYMEPAGNGLFREVKNEELFEGLTLKIHGDCNANDPDVIDVKELSVRLSECIDRAPLEGSDLKVGQPTIHTTSLNVAFSIRSGMCAVLPLPHDNEDQPAFVVVVKIDRRPIDAAITKP